jgi:hypothetical protein
MIPIILPMLKLDQSVVVVTASKKLLTSDFFSAVGGEVNHRVTLVGLDESEVFYSMCMGGKDTSYKTDDLRVNVVLAILQVPKKDPKIAAILMKCTSLPPFTVDVKVRTGLPIFDFTACIGWMNGALHPKIYKGYF